MNEWLSGLQTLLIPVLLTAALLLLILADLLLPFRGGKDGSGGNPKNALGVIAFLQLAAVAVVSWLSPASGLWVGKSWVDDSWTVFLHRLFLTAGMLAVLGMYAHGKKNFARRQGEFYTLLFASLIGMTLLAGARDLLLIVVAFELMGMPLYIMAAYGKTDGDSAQGPAAPGLLRATPARRPAEAGLKLYLVGAVSAAITLYGVSLLYGLSGSTQLVDLAKAPSSPLLFVGVAMTIAGFSFKLGLAPFQFWIPDTYQGAPTPFVSFLSVAPKAAGLTALGTILLIGFGQRGDIWIPTLLAVAVVTMVAGNLLALPQLHLKRLLGNSGVAQMGTMIIGLLAVGVQTAHGQPDPAGLRALLFYFVGYLAANTGLFLVVEALAASRTANDAPETRDMIAGLSGLNRRSPGLALAALLCLLSLAGIPFVVGFWAKLYVFVAAWQAGQAWLVILAAALAVIGLFYYLRVARSMYLGEPTTEAPVPVPWSLKIAILVTALATAGLGLMPGPLVEAARAAVAGFTGL
jgi:NADH-quinone oxidoreductase subunit N